MKQYEVFKHPSGASEAVKQGWSWPAFFFGFIWAMTKKLWAIGFGVLAGAFVVGFILAVAGAGEGGDLLMNIASLIVSIIFGLNGNSWRRNNLISRGYEQADIVTAANQEDALALHLKAAMPSASA